jgi:hypothetical protein
MRKNITLVMVAAVFVGIPAIAKTHRPQLKKHNPVAPMRFSELSPKSFKEKLPIQLSEPMTKIAKAKYKPSRLP